MANVLIKDIKGFYILVIISYNSPIKKAMPVIPSSPVLALLQGGLDPSKINFGYP
jgi:hypothetical protein